MQTSIDLALSDVLLNPYYTVKLGAGCEVGATGWILTGYGGYYDENPQQAECTATVDPTILFDQATFDALYGVETFTLADYFILDFSPNLNMGDTTPPDTGTDDGSAKVPEPGSFILLLIGIPGLFLKRHKFTAQQIKL